MWAVIFFPKTEGAQRLSNSINTEGGSKLSERTDNFESGRIFERWSDEEENVDFTLQRRMAVSERLNNVHFTRKGEIVTIVNYFELTGLLMPKLKSKNRGKLLKSVFCFTTTLGPLPKKRPLSSISWLCLAEPLYKYCHDLNGSGFYIF